MSAFAMVPRPDVVSASNTEHSEQRVESRPERRRSGRRARARDRLFDRAVQANRPNTALVGFRNVENLLLFVDDDLRETTVALTRIESFLTRALGVLEAREPQRDEVQALAYDRDVLDQLDLLNETLESLRRRLARLASAMK